MMRALLVAALCTGCAADPPSCVENYRTVTRGIYGGAVYVDMKGNSEPLVKVALSISDRTGSYVDLRTDEHGLYELAVSDGSYSICSDFLAVGCYTISLGYTDIELLRVDLHVDEGFGGYWGFPIVGSCP